MYCTSESRLPLPPHWGDSRRRSNPKKDFSYFATPPGFLLFSVVITFVAFPHITTALREYDVERAGKYEVVLPVFTEQFASCHIHIATVLEAARKVLTKAKVVLPQFRADSSVPRLFGPVPYEKLLDKDWACAFIGGRCDTVWSVERNISSILSNPKRPKVAITHVEFFAGISKLDTEFRRKWWPTEIVPSATALLPHAWRRPVAGVTPEIPGSRKFSRLPDMQIITGLDLEKQHFESHIADKLKVRLLKWVPLEKRPSTEYVLRQWSSLQEGVDDVDVHLIVLWFTPWKGLDAPWWELQDYEAEQFFVDLHPRLYSTVEAMMRRVGGINVALHWRTETADPSLHCAAVALQAMKQVSADTPSVETKMWLLTDVSLEGEPIKSHTILFHRRTTTTVVGNFVKFVDFNQTYEQPLAVWTLHRASGLHNLSLESYAMSEIAFLDLAAAVLAPRFWFWGPSTRCARSSSRFTALIRMFRHIKGLPSYELQGCTEENWTKLRHESPQPGSVGDALGIVNQTCGGDLLAEGGGRADEGGRLAGVEDLKVVDGVDSMGMRVMMRKKAAAGEKMFSDKFF